jgi:hypothetical protein
MPSTSRAAAVATGFAAGALACNAIIGLTDVPPVADAEAGDAAVVPATDASMGAPEAAPPAHDGGPTHAADADLGEASAGVCGPHGTDCLGGGCVDGQCQAFAFWTTDSGLVPHALAQDDAFLYWTDSFTNVGRTNKATGATTILYADAVLPQSVAVDDAGIYWGDDDGIYRCLKSGCPDSGPAVVATTVHETGAYSLAIDDVHVYWSEESANVYVAHKYGTAETPTALWNGDASVDEVTTDGQQVYFTADDGLLRVMGVDGGGVRTFGQPGQTASLGVALDSNTVFWTVGAPVDTVLAVGKTSPAGSGSTLAGSQANPQAVASDGLDVYWANTGVTSTIAECAIASCSPTTIVSGLNLPSALVVDSVAVYFTDANSGSNGTLWKIAK